MKRQSIGFGHELELDWLNYTAAKTAAGKSRKEIEEALWAYLDGSISGEGTRSSRHKTITMLLRIWPDVPESRRSMRDRASALLSAVNPDERSVVHWAMTASAYPFFSDVCATIGRLLNLQGGATLAQTTRRMVETWGDRSTMIRATRRVMQSLDRWGALHQDEAPGLYIASEKRIPVTGDLAILIVDSLIRNSNIGSIRLGDVASNPALFHFAVSVSSDEIRKFPGFEIRQDPLSGVEVSLRDTKKER